MKNNKYIIRSGNKRGRGQYLTCSPPGVISAGMYHYTRRKRRAVVFNSVDAACLAASKCWHIDTYRVVKLITRQ